MDRERYLLVPPRSARNHKQKSTMFKVGDLVQINSSYEDNSPPDLGIVVDVWKHDSIVLDMVWYKVWVRGNFIEFLEEELELAIEIAAKNKSRRFSKDNK